MVSEWILFPGIVLRKSLYLLLRRFKAEQPFSNKVHNPLRTIGSPVTHENWPMNWPNFAVSPALLGWPARNRHTAACIHRFSHLLRTPPVPVVWIMSESRAVANEHEGHKRTIPIISSSFWMTVVLKGLMASDLCCKQCNVHWLPSAGLMKVVIYAILSVNSMNKTCFPTQI